MLKRDDESRTRLQYAEQSFRKLLDTHIQDDEHYRHLESWLLACFACDLENQYRAQQYCIDLLENDPPLAQAIIWAQAREWAIDLTQYEAKLQNIYTHGSATSVQVIAIVCCALKRGCPAEALTLLQETSAIFERERVSDLHMAWQIHTLGMADRIDEALVLLSRNEYLESNSDLKSELLRRQAFKTNDWQLLQEHLLARYMKTRNPEILLEWCNLLAAQDNWALIAEKSDELVQSLPTPEVINLITDACSRVHEYDHCLDIINRYGYAFGAIGLPDPLQRRRIDAIFHIGRLLEAIEEAKTLVQPHPTTPNILLLAYFYRCQPDLVALTLIARILVEREDIPSEVALDIANLVQDKDHNLAQILWRIAVANDLSDTSLGTAVMLGMQLGLTREVGPLFLRAQEYNDKDNSTLWKGNLTELPDIISQFRETIEFVTEQFQQARCPIHAILAKVNQTLVDLYHIRLSQNAEIPQMADKYPIWVRYGSRPLSKYNISNCSPSPSSGEIFFNKIANI